VRAIVWDWLARWVYERRAERERTAKQERAKEEHAKQLAESQAQQRRLRATMMAVMTIAGLIGVAAVVSFVSRSLAIAAQKYAEKAEEKAAHERDDANDLRVLTGYIALRNQGEMARAIHLLTAVKKPADNKAWVTFANEALQTNALFVTLRGHREALVTAVFSPDGKRVLTASTDSTARIFDADGTGEPLVLQGHEGPITSAAFSPVDDPETLRVLTTSAVKVTRSTDAWAPRTMRPSRGVYCSALPIRFASA
jgi:hypothetical protein